MATTFVDHDGDGNATKSFSFPSIKEADIKVEVDDVLKTSGNHYNITSYTTTGGGDVVFTTNNIPQTSSNKIRIFRDTDVDTAKATYQAGSSVKAGDLNINNKQLLYAAQEEQNQIRTSRIKDGAVTTDKLANDAVTTLKILDDNVTMAKLGSGALPTDITVASANIVDGTIVNADINTSAAIAGTKISPDFGSQNIATTGTVDGRDVSVDGTKLDGIEAGATADQSNAEIRAAVEAATDSNVFTDADHTKLNGIETGATADQTNAEIKTAYEANADTNEFSDAEQTKLANIETAATADQTASEIKTLLQSDKLTISEMNTTSLDGRYFTETESDARYFRQDSTETIESGDTWSGGDVKIATTGAIDLRIIELVDNVGGFVPIANETSFPAANPDINTSGSAKGGTIVSVQTASTNLTAQSGTTLTIANGRGTGNAVIITGVSATIPSGYGFLVETTATDHTYAFHRLVPKATEVATVAANAVNIAAAGANVANIDSFADRYQISTSAPTDRADSSSLQNGDLWFDSSSNKVMMVYDGSTGDGFSPITPNQSDLTNINIVAGHITFAEDLGLITNAVNTGSGNNSVNTVATNITNVNTAATNIAKITTVADDLTEGTSEIDTVATNIANVNTVGNAIANVNTTAGSIANVNTTAGSIANVNTTAGSISNVNTVASNITDVNTFANRYRIASSAPNTSLDEGDLYFDTTQDELRIYNGSAWQGGVTATGNLVLKSGSQMTGNLTFSGTQTVDGRDLSVDGSKLDGIENGATADQTASEVAGLISGQTIAPNVITTTNLTLDFGTI